MSSDLSATVQTRRATAALVALSVSCFIYVTTELLPVGLLTVIADDLEQSRAHIGLTVTGYAVVVVLMSIPLVRLTQRVPRRLLLTGTLGALVLGTLLSALAPSYPVLLVARLLVALTQALFWSVVSSTATGLFPPEVRGRVVARMAIGTSLAPVVGVPVGTWLGQQAGWRTAFLVLAGLSLVTCLVVAVTLPSTAREDDAVTQGTTPDGRRFALLVVVSTLAVAGAMTTYTYVTPFLLDVSHFSAGALGPVLAVAGVAGVLGTLVAGRFLDRYPSGVLLATVGVITVALIGLAGLGESKAVAVLLLALLGLGFSAFATAVQNRTLQLAPGSTDLASAGSSSAFNLGTACGSLLGGALIATVGVRSVAVVGAALTTVAVAGLLVEALVIGRSGRRPVRAAARAACSCPVGAADCG